MARNDKLSSARKLVHLRGEHAAPSAKPLLGELRTAQKWETGAPVEKPFLPLEQFMIAWSYGVPFGQMDDFHTFLRDNENFIAAACRVSMENHVGYLGTYLNTDGGSPMYRTYWGYDSLEAIGLWEDALKVKRSRFYQAMKTLRSYWARDPGRSENRYGLASYYSDLANLPSANAITALTLDAAGIKAAPEDEADPRKGKDRKRHK